MATATDNKSPDASAAAAAAKPKANPHGLVKVSVTTPITAAQQSWVAEMQKKYGLDDFGKAMRIVCNFALRDGDTKQIFQSRYVSVRFSFVVLIICGSGFFLVLFCLFLGSGDYRAANTQSKSFTFDVYAHQHKWLTDNVSVAASALPPASGAGAPAVGLDDVLCLVLEYCRLVGNEQFIWAQVRCNDPKCTHKH